MNYIDPAQYNELLKNFAKGTPKQVLKEGYVDLRPINSLDEAKPTEMASVYAKYPEAMYETDKVKNPGKYAGGPRAAFDKDGDGIPDGADKNPTDGSKQEEGLHLGHPTARNIDQLTVEERKELKSYVEAIKTTKKAIEELLQKANGRVQTEGGDTTDLTMPTEE